MEKFLEPSTVPERVVVSGGFFEAFAPPASSMSPSPSDATQASHGVFSGGHGSPAAAAAAAAAAS